MPCEQGLPHKRGRCRPIGRCAMEDSLESGESMQDSATQRLMAHSARVQAALASRNNELKHKAARYGALYAVKLYARINAPLTLARSSRTEPVHWPR